MEPQNQNVIEKYELLSAKEAADYLGMSITQIYKEIKKDPDNPLYKTIVLKGRKYLSKQLIDSYINNQLGLTTVKENNENSD